MATFEEFLGQSTALGSNIVPGCVLMAVDKQGKIVYSRSSGYDSVLPDAKPIDPNGAFWIASCSKLVGTIAALQCVERSLFTLDEPVSKILPELSDMQIITPGTDAGSTHQFKYTKATKQITLRQLLTHTSGLGYDIMDPTIMAWRSSRNEQLKSLSGTVVEAQLVPLLFEPGEGWSYGGGIDWVGLLSTSFRLEKHPEIKEKIVSTSERHANGTLQPSQKLWTDHAPEDCAGAGLYSAVPDYIKIIGDLVKDSPTLLKREVVEQIFEGQLPQGSSALKGLGESPEILLAMTGTSDIKKVNFSLGELYLDEGTEGIKPGTLCWGGLPNLYWFANRKEGLAGFYASQVLPPGDPASGRLARAFFQEVYRLNSA